MTKTKSSDGGMDKIAKRYVRIRDARTALKKSYEEADSQLKEELDALDAQILQQLNTVGADSVRTKYGTIYRQLDVIPSASDWDQVYNFIKENDAFEMLERRLKRTFVKEFMEEHDGQLPPGVAIHQQYVARVRR